MYGKGEMTKKKAHIDETSARRYLNKEMTDAERNAFEKELQKDPFAAEALEGLEPLSGAAFDQDLKELKARINKPKKKKRIPYYAAAASILLLVTAGVLWMQLDKQNPVPHLSENKIEEEIKTGEAAKETVEKIEEKAAPVLDEKRNDLQTEKINNTNTSKEMGIRKESIVEKSETKRMEKAAVPVQKERESEVLEMEDQSLELDNEILFAAPKSKAAIARSEKKLHSLVQGIVVSADDQQPIPGVSVTGKGTNKGVITDLEGRFNLPLNQDSSATLIASFVGMEAQEFQPNSDSNNIIELEPSQLALDEVVVVGYGSKQKKQVTGSVQVVKTEPQNSDAKPSVGFDKYFDYLNEHALLPADYPEQKLVVKVKIELDANGNILRITNANKTNEEYFTKAKTLIEDGPGWQPKYFNDRQVKSSVKFRIVFRKAENND